MIVDSFKTTAVGDIPAHMLKSTVYVHLPFINKKNDPDKENERPVSALSHVSKVLESCTIKLIIS